MAITQVANKEVKINLLDLPLERFYVKINEDLSNKILLRLKKKIGSLSTVYKKIGINSLLYYSWINKKEYPLSVLVKLFELVDLKKEEIQDNLICLRSGYYPPRRCAGGNLSQPINPKFPIELSKELARILAHFFGDGCVSIDKHGYITAAYYNQNKELRDQFKMDINSVFRFNNFVEKINKQTEYIPIPTPIAVILLQIVKDFRSNKSEVPTFIKNSEKSIKKEFLSSFFDDEAYVRFCPPSRYIEIATNNKFFLEELRILLKEFDIDTKDVTHKTIRGFDIYTFYIRHYENLKKFCEKINFYHPKKKDKLKKIVNNPGRKSYAHGETEKRILSLISEGHSSKQEIKEKLKRKESTVNYWLNKLNAKGKIKKGREMNGNIIWSLK